MRPSERMQPATGGNVRGGRIDPGLVILLGGAALIAAMYAFRADHNGASRGGASVFAATVPPLTLVRENGGKQPLLPPGAKGAVVHIWGPWCSPCVRELPMWLRMQAKLDQAKMPVRLISCGYSMPENLAEAAEAARNTLRARAPGLKTFFDPSGKVRSEILSAAGSQSFPTTVLLDHTGKVQGVWIGSSPGDETSIFKAASALLAAPGEVPPAAAPAGTVTGPAEAEPAS